VAVLNVQLLLANPKMLITTSPRCRRRCRRFGSAFSLAQALGDHLAQAGYLGKQGIKLRQYLG
jgi:hypothetical protein